MKGIKTFVANLANRINQAHYLEIELRKVFHAGVRYAQENDGWVSPKALLPDLIPGQDYSENVLAMIEGVPHVRVMCLCLVKGDDGKWGYVWGNAQGDIYGDAEIDDDYVVTMWRHIPKWNPES